MDRGRFEELWATPFTPAPAHPSSWRAQLERSGAGPMLGAEELEPARHAPVFSADARRTAALLGAMAAVPFVLLSCFFHGYRADMTLWMLPGLIYLPAAGAVGVAASRRTHPEMRLSWRLWVASLAVMGLGGFLVLARVWGLVGGGVLNELTGTEVSVAGMLLFGAPAIRSIALLGGLRHIVIDLLDVTAGGLGIMAVPVAVLAGPVSRAPASWIGLPALGIGVVVGLFGGVLAAQALWAGRDAWAVFRPTIEAFVAGVLVEGYSVAEVLTRYRLPAWPWTLFMCMMLTVYVRLPMAAQQMSLRGLERLQPSAQVHRTLVGSWVAVGSAGVLLFEAAVWETGRGVALGAAALIGVQLILSVVARRLGVAETVHISGLLERSLAEQRFQARTDRLTGLANRRALEDAFLAEVARYRRSPRPISIAILDLDHFKAHNDRFGHVAGDHLLVDFAASLTRAVRRYDLVARFGGEEFVVVLPSTERLLAWQVVEGLRERLHGDWELGGYVTFSAGVAEWQPGESFEHLMARADAALYEAKRSGRDRVVLAER